ncbi:hypothetical protein MMC07_003455 [Pseudocyphellaria aurata]|nr:hypothetical protein [Pseudocyphellaria aurata]
MNNKKTNDKKTNDKKTNDKKTNDKKTNDKKTNDKKTNDNKTNDNKKSDKSLPSKDLSARPAVKLCCLLLMNTLRKLIIFGASEGNFYFNGLANRGKRLKKWLSEEERKCLEETRQVQTKMEGRELKEGAEAQKKLEQRIKQKWR